MNANTSDPLLAKVDNIADQLRDLRRDIKYRRVGVWTIGWGVFWGLALWSIITAVIGWVLLALFAAAVGSAMSQAQKAFPAKPPTSVNSPAN